MGGPSRAVALAHRLQTGLHDTAARVAQRRGWTSAIVPHVGYGGSGRVRVLASVLLAAPGTDPAARRGVPGWQRFLTVALPGVEVAVEVGGRRVTARSDQAGLLDTTVDAFLPTGPATATLSVQDRSAQAPILVAAPDAPLGVVCAIDDTVWVTGLATPVRAAWRILARSRAGRRPVRGMAGLMSELVADLTGAPVVYVSNGAWHLAGPVSRFLERSGFPAGALLMTDGGTSPRAWRRDRKALERGALERVCGDFPAVRWVLVGDDGGHHPEIYTSFATRRPDRVAAIALRQVAAGPAPPAGSAAGVPVLRASDGGGLLRQLREVLGMAEPAGSDREQWLLSGDERGNDATRLRAWTSGNSARPLVHGRSYFPVLAAALEQTGPGDLVFFADWRGDPDEALTDDGRTVGQLLSEASRRGALVKGLLWRSHLDRLRFSAEQNRDLSENVNDDGGEVLLDQRVRPLGSHHQKFVVIRHRDRPQDDVAFVGGIDLGHSRRDDAEHQGDPQTQPFARVYGDSPAWHDVQLELRGPVVREVEEVFRERWADPAALSRLPWQAIPDLVRRGERDPSHLPEPMPAPPEAGTCAVQLLRTYPNRWPGYPFAPNGERSAARAYAKALRRARRLVYIEDQYLWSTDVAQVFAEALRRSPGLHLVAVVPRHPDQDGISVPPALLGHAQALTMVRDAGGERVQVLDVENRAGKPVYVHAKVCVVDDVWAAVGSDNFNRRSWTHDSELSAAVLDDERDPREPADPAGLGDGARRFARELRLELMREHLDRTDDDTGLLDPDSAAEAIRASADVLDAWHLDGRTGPRPPGRLRPHRVRQPPRWQQILSAPAYRLLFDPDGRPPGMKLRKTL